MGGVRGCNLVFHKVAPGRTHDLLRKAYVHACDRASFFLGGRTQTHQVLRNAYVSARLRFVRGRTHDLLRKACMVFDRVRLRFVRGCKQPLFFKVAPG